MLKLIIKLAIAGLIANAVWRVGMAYTSFYRFKDAVAEKTIYAKGKSDDELRQVVMDLASTYDAPVPEDRIEIHRETNHVFITSSYTKPIDVLPGFEYQWPFTLKVDAYVISPVKLGDAASPPTQ